jgi:hypothetical protein
MRASTVQKLLGSFRFLQSSAPRVIERAHERETFDAPLPSMAAVEFVKKATEVGAADEETLRTIHRAAFDEGAEAPVLARRFKEAAFPESPRESKDRLRGQIAQAARKLAALIADEGSPVPKKLAISVEEALGELLAVVEPPN